MATKKTTTKKLGKATGVAAARKPKKGKTDEAGALMKQTAKADALEVKLGQAATHIKDCHGLVSEAEVRLRACRKATSPSGAIVHDLERILDLASEIGDESEKALKALKR